MSQDLIIPDEERSADRRNLPACNGDFDDARMELIMGRLLQCGVLLSAAVVSMAGIMYMFAHVGEPSHYRVFIARPLRLRHPAALPSGLLSGNASAVIQLGILLLVATPVCRVLFAIVAFVLEGDRLYVIVSLLVLAVLLFGMFHGG
jgi:uncharacterized membrane protein